MPTGHDFREGDWVAFDRVQVPGRVIRLAGDIYMEVEGRTLLCVEWGGQIGAQLEDPDKMIVVRRDPPAADAGPSPHVEVKEMPKLWYTVSFEAKMEAGADYDKVAARCKAAVEAEFGEVSAVKVHLAPGEMGPIPFTTEEGDLVRWSHNETLGDVIGVWRDGEAKVVQVRFPWGEEAVRSYPNADPRERHLILVAKANKAEETKEYYGQK